MVYSFVKKKNLDQDVIGYADRIILLSIEFIRGNEEDRDDWNLNDTQIHT